MLFLEISQNSQENICAELEAYNFIKKENLAQVFSCKFCEISKNTLSYRRPTVAAFLFGMSFLIALCISLMQSCR